MGEERRRTRGKRGIKTKATVRNNGYDHLFHTRQAILTFPDEEAVPYSLNKGKRWAQVEELKQQLAHSHDSDDDDHGDQQPADTPTSVKEVMEVQVHQRDVIGSLSWRVTGLAVPAKGCFGKEKRGRDYTRVEVSVCAGCGGERAVLAPRDPDEVRRSSWALRQTPEELALARKARREKQAEDRKRREQRKLRHAPKAEKKDRRRGDEGVEQGGGEENAREKNEAEGPVESGSESQESLGEEESDCSSADEDSESEEQGEEDDDEADENDEEDGSGDEQGNDVCKNKDLPQEEGVEENADEEEGQTSEGTVLTSQEKWRITPKEGRLIVHKPFAKDQYPMYRETNWKYTSPCMCCLHSSGSMWQLKGMGDKSKGKTKGYRKVQRRDFKNVIKGEA